jgi:thiosulfate/3-mercaptopyruvate sulfurtransferase
MKRRFWRTLLPARVGQRRDWRSNVFTFLIAFVAFAVVMPLLPLHPTQASTPGNVRFVEPAWVTDHASDPNLRILDVRLNPLDYITEHIPNAVHVADSTFRGPNGALPVQYWQTDKLQSIFTQAGVTDKSSVLVYSADRDVLGATMVAYLLERSGHGNVAVLDGGFKAYKAASLPTAKQFPTYAAGTFTIQDDASVRVTIDQVRDLIGQPNVVFIDPRPPELFAGEQDIWVRNGHIPGAKNIPWQSFTIGEENFHKLKSLDEIQQILTDRNITPDNEIIVTCSTGREATLQYTVLKHLLGYPNVRVYEGSWTEYSANPDLPVETGRDA